MHDDLPTDFDIVVVGTGLSESIIAAAASRIGKKVLHVDNNDYYGDLWASFNLDGLQKFIAVCKNADTNPSTDLPAVEDGEVLIPTNNSVLIQNINEEWYIPKEAALLSDALQKCKLTQTDEKKSEELKDGEGDVGTAKEIDSTDVEKSESPRRIKNSQWTQDKIMQEYRKFNIDLAPKLLYSRGSLVELLISSNIARYAEFRNVSRILTWLSDSLQEVPCSRSDVFATKQVSVVEKRILMKLLTDVMDNDKDWDAEGYTDVTFNEFLEKHNLTPNVIYYVLYTMAAATKETSFKDGLERMKKFLNSLGRYGNTPFLWAMYGSGEIPQCFCRLCAVFGGTYCLNRPIKGVILDSENSCKGIYIGEQRINAPTIVMGVGKTPSSYLPTSDIICGVSHAVFIIDRSIKDSEKENLTYLRFPPLYGKYPCNVIEVGPAASACPNNLYLLHLYIVQQSTPKEDLEPYVSKLINTCNLEETSSQSTQTNSSEQQSDASNLPQALWSFYYSIPDYSKMNLQNNLPNNFYLCAGPDHEIDYEFAVQQAKNIFATIYPNEEFLPRAPDPEEIVLEGEDAEDNANKDENNTGSNDISQAEEVTEN